MDSYILKYIIFTLIWLFQKKFEPFSRSIY